MLNIVGNLFCTQPSLSSFLGLLFDLGLSDSASTTKKKVFSDDYLVTIK